MTSRWSCERVPKMANDGLKWLKFAAALIILPPSPSTYMLQELISLEIATFYSSYVLAHFQVFTVQSHATQIPLCADAVIWVTLPVSYFHFRLFLSWGRWGEGEMKGHALIHSGKWEGHDFFLQKISKITRHPPPPKKNKKRTFPYE